MSQQSSIKSFFSSKSTCSASSENSSMAANANGDADGQPPAKKKAKIEQESNPDKIMTQKRIFDLCEKYPGALHKNIGLTWFEALEPEFYKPYFQCLSKFVAAERASKTIFPPPQNVWTWTRDFEVKNTRVVILGQDPYHGPDQAHGLCFSVQQGVDVTPSLKNMYKELATDIQGFKNPGEVGRSYRIPRTSATVSYTHLTLPTTPYV